MAVNEIIAAYKAAGLIPVLTVAVRSEADIVGARQRARQLAALLGFGNQDQVRIATAVSEVARSAHQHGGGRVQFAVALNPRPQALWVTIEYSEPGPSNPDDLLASREADG